ncbi:hypothetical protein KGF54_000972 [Candida jiufengensis]|uniref:uncharacterized protein n=1 Tax=Candida jiufengensis TaxID=497108 RepID=UPI002224F89B|nr:uncharacterized protein KGF54_000972 [Candida jiufengensis]KAI5956497.1 hypothetical protein KGF54_000972 [Candida jiufengensis]
MLSSKAFIILGCIFNFVQSIFIENAFTTTESINYLYQTPLYNLHILNNDLLVAKNKANQLIGIDLTNENSMKWNLGDLVNDYQLIFNNDEIYGWKESGGNEIIKIETNGSFEYIDVGIEVGHLYKVQYGGIIMLGINGELIFIDQNNNSHSIKSTGVSTVLIDSYQGNIFLVINGKEILKLTSSGAFINEKSITLDSIKEFKSGIALTHNDQIFKVDQQLNFKRIENDRFNNLAVINSNFLYSKSANNVKLITIEKKVAKEIHNFKTTSLVKWYSNPFSEILIVSDDLTRIFYDLSDFLYTKKSDSIKKVQLKLERDYPYDFVIKTQQNDLGYLALDDNLNGELFSLFNGQRLKTISPSKNQYSSSKDLYILIDAPESEQSKIENEHLSKEFNNGLIFTNWLNRVVTHLADVGRFFVDIPNWFTNIDSTNSIFNKLVVFYDDKIGKLIAVNSHDEGTAWTTDIGSEEIISLKQLNEENNGNIIALFKDTIHIIDPNDGKVVESFKNNNYQDVKIVEDHYVLENETGFSLSSPVDSDISLFKKTESELIGHIIPQGKTSSIKTWSFHFNDPVVQIATIPKASKISSVGIPLVDKSILYKYLNRNLITIITMEENLKLYLIDGITGDLLYTYSSQNEIIDPNSISLVIDDNWIVYSYFTISPRLEQRINVIDLFSNKQNSKITKISKQSFIYPERILKLSSTQSKHGITIKSIVVLTESGSIVEIPKFILNSRRPTTEMKQDDFGNDFKLFPYDPIVPKNHNQVINHKYQLNSTNGKLLVKPTQYESSSVVCYFNSQNQFCSILKPSLSFDLLNKKFEKGKLIGTIVILIVGYLVSKPYVNKKKLKSQWLDFK